MRDTNVCILTGNVGKDCEVRYAANGTAFTSFSIANNQDWKGKDGVEHKKVSWINAVIVGARGPAVSKFLKKGARVLIQGQYTERTWDDKDGQKRRQVEITIDMNGDIHILKFPDDQKAPQGTDAPLQKEYDSNPPGRPGGGPSRPGEASLGGHVEQDSDLPF